MNKREVKNAIYNEISRVAKAISNANRLEIIDFIANGPKSVEDIALQTGNSIANTSQHLQTLKKERLVSTKKKGVKVYYSLASEEIYYAWKSLRDLTLEISPFAVEAVNNLKHNFDDSDKVSLSEIKERDDIFLLDVRPEDEYFKNHLPKAHSIPIEKLNHQLDQLPKDKLIIAYCRGMFCTFADEAIGILHENGFQAKKIEESVLDYHFNNKKWTTYN